MNNTLANLLSTEQDTIEFKALFENAFSDDEINLVIFLYQHQHFIATMPRFGYLQDVTINMYLMYENYKESLAALENKDAEEVMEFDAYCRYSIAHVPPCFSTYCIWVFYFFLQNSIQGMPYFDYSEQWKMFDSEEERFYFIYGRTFIVKRTIYDVERHKWYTRLFPPDWHDKDPNFNFEKWILTKKNIQQF